MILDSRIAENSTYDIGNAIRSIDVTDVGLQIQIFWSQAANN